MPFHKLLFCFVLVFTVPLVYGQDTFRDNFSAVSYSNNNGTSNFSTNWIENGDTNAGPNSEYIRISSNRLEFYYIWSESIRRSADLSGASSATLTFDWQAISLGGSRALAVQISNNGGTSYTTIGTVSGNSSTGSFSQDISAYISANTTIRFLKSNQNWRNDDYAYIDNLEIATTTVAPSPVIDVSDAVVNEDAGNLTFTITHTGINTSGPFTLNYQTSDVSATAGADYTSSSGSLIFNGNMGGTSTVTVPILDDALVEISETFTLQIIATSDPAVDITDVGTGTITDDDSITMTNGTVNECGKVFFDPGSLSNYANNENVVYTICPDIANSYLNVDFTTFDVRAGDFLYIYEGTNTSGTLIGQYDNNNIPTSINSSDGSGCLTFRFTSNGNTTGAGWEADVNCIADGPEIIIDDISFNEDIGNAVFTVRSTRAPHGRNFFLLGFVETSFTVDFQTVDGSALAGSDYTAITGTLTFNGEVGNIQTISIPISNDGIPEIAEDFTIEFTGVNAPDAPVNFSDTGTGTINSQILANDPLTLFQEFDGYYDYSTTGGSLRTTQNGATGDACLITTTSSNQLVSPIPPTATIERAYLYWAHSSAVRDETVTFEGQSVSANFVYQTAITTRNFYGYVSDVTSIVQGIANPSTNTYNFTGLTIDNSATYCGSETVLGGWTLMVFYEDKSLPAVNINLYQGFDGFSNAGTSFTLDSFYAIAGAGAKATFLSWEGDSTLDGAHPSSTNPEELSITNQANATFILSGDGGQPGNNAYNSTIYDNTVGPPAYNIATSYGVDLDTYDIAAFISPGDSQVTANVDAGQDFVISAAVVLKVPSNLIAGNVFEDHNYPGGVGRDRITSGGPGVSGAVVELFDSTGSFMQRKTTNSSGYYSFGGMADGSYSVKAVNYTVRSNRTGGLNCSSCYPVQTFRKFGGASSFTDVTDEVGGANPSATQDVALGVLTGAQSVSSTFVASNGVVGIDFGFNFNTIVNTNEDGQGSLELFIVNSNNLDETGLDIEANSIFNPAPGDDTSIFMIPPTGDALGRTADVNFASGYFDISISNAKPLTTITDDNTKLDGRTQTAYSGNSNSGTIGAGGSTVGISVNILPVYDLPEIQVHRNDGDVIKASGSDVVIRNLSVYGSDNAAVRVDGGAVTVSNNLLGVNAVGVKGGNVLFGTEVVGGLATIEANYISRNDEAGIWVNGGTSTLIQDNHLTTNGSGPCDDNVLTDAGTGIVIRRNLIELAAGLGIDGDGVSENLTITENTIVESGQNGVACSGSIENAGIRLEGDNSSVTNNIIASNGGAGIVLAGGNTTGNLISQNSIYANGTSAAALGIDIDLSSAMGDGITLNDLTDLDNGPNGAINFPLITSSLVSGSTLVVRGWSRPGAIIEWFLTDINEGTATAGDNQLGLSTDYGEGQIYFGTSAEGSASDLDSSSSSYTDLDGNTDTTNKFHFIITLPPLTEAGDIITSTATLGNSTSEFSPSSILKTPTVITNRRITYRVKKD